VSQKTIQDVPCAPLVLLFLVVECRRAPLAEQRQAPRIQVRPRLGGVRTFGGVRQDRPAHCSRESWRAFAWARKRSASASSRVIVADMSVPPGISFLPVYRNQDKRLRLFGT
jgi:hypothetical protein